MLLAITVFELSSGLTYKQKYPIRITGRIPGQIIGLSSNFQGARSHAHLPVRSWSATIILEVKTVSGPLRSPSISLTDPSLSVGVSDRIGPQWASLSLSEVNTRSFHRPMHVSTVDQERHSTSNHPGDVTRMS